MSGGFASSKEHADWTVQQESSRLCYLTSYADLLKSGRLYAVLAETTEVESTNCFPTHLAYCYLCTGNRAFLTWDQRLSRQ